MRYRITVNQAALKKGEPNVIHVHDSERESRFDCSNVALDGPSVIRYEPSGGLADGSRVWIETNDLPLMTISMEPQKQTTISVRQCPACGSYNGIYSKYRDGGSTLIHYNCPKGDPDTDWPNPDWKFRSHD